jgi:putative transposase
MSETTEKSVLSTCGQRVAAAAIMAMKPAIQTSAVVIGKLFSYVGYRFPPDVISYAVWLYYRFPLGLRMAEELLTARDIELTDETAHRSDRHAGRRPIRKLLRKHGYAPWVLVTGRLRSYTAANRDLGINVEHLQSKGLNYQAENSHQPSKVREKVMCHFKSAPHLQCFASAHEEVAHLLMHCCYQTNPRHKRMLCTQAFEAWECVACAPMLERLVA